METLEMEIETEVETNNIDFDFLKNEEQTSTYASASNNDWINQETLVVVVNAKDNSFSNFEICGKKMIDWVSLACSGCKQKFVDETDDILSAIRPIAENYEFVAVLFSDTPLLKKSTFIEVMNYFSKNRMNVLTLPRGYVFKNEFLQNAKMLMSSAIVDFDKEDFCVIDNEEQLSLAFDVLNDRILNYHKQNGVVLLGQNTIFIDADVEIEEGVVIHPNNVIKGNTYIGKDVVIESGCVIENSIVCDKAVLKMCHLDNSKVNEGKTVSAFSKLINQEV